jgi:hypothetical protein
MKRRFLVLFPLALAMGGGAFAQDTTNAASGSTSTNVTGDSYDDWQAQAKQKTQDAYKLWVVEKSQARQSDVSSDLIADAVESGDKNIVAEVLRGGPHREKLVLLPKETTQVVVQKLSTLEGVTSAQDDASQYDHSSNPIFRRITANCFEAWTPTDGWLFDAKGKLLRHVKVPRRDGTGRKWYGAFLPSGRWITTDLWNDDRQLNCYDSAGKNIWELRGRNMIFPPTDPAAKEPAPGAADPGEDEDPVRWARSDKDGKGWVACPGFYDPQYVWVSPEGKPKPVPGNNPWALTYPRAMLAKDTPQHTLGIPSDDGTQILGQTFAWHGNWIDFPTYRVASWPRDDVIPEGDVYFGFWPGSHDAWVEADHVTYDHMGNQGASEKKIWFLDENGKYVAEMNDVSWLGDAADGKSLLVHDAQHRAVTISAGPKAIRMRQFEAAGQVLMPVALYDDLKLGFFLDPGVSGIVLARW